MPAPSLGGLAEGRGSLADVCLAIPAMFLSENDLCGAARVLTQVALLIGREGAGGYVPISADVATPDIFASLWFIRAAHLFGKAARAAASAPEMALFTDQLLPINKKILQQLIAENGVGGIRMDDGGLLIPPPTENASQTLRLNTIWYAALEATAADLKMQEAGAMNGGGGGAGGGDRVADHFERLAGRFRRSFAKAYWCDMHGCICTPESRAAADHGEFPDADQLLLTCLSVSPIPRTKQRQLLQHVQAKALGPKGIRVRHASRGVVESPMHLAWLALGIAASADPPAIGRAEAAGIVAMLAPLRAQAHVEGLAAWYGAGGGAAVVDGNGAGENAVTTAEVLGALALLR